MILLNYDLCPPNVNLIWESVLSQWNLKSYYSASPVVQQLVQSLQLTLVQAPDGKPVLVSRCCSSEQFGVQTLDQRHQAALECFLQCKDTIEGKEVQPSNLAHCKAHELEPLSVSLNLTHLSFVLFSTQVLIFKLIKLTN